MKRFLLVFLSFVFLLSPLCAEEYSKKIGNLLNNDTALGVSSDPKRPDLDRTLDFINSFADATKFAENGGIFNVTVSSSGGFTSIESNGDARFDYITNLLNGRDKEINVKAMSDIINILKEEQKNSEIEKLFKMLNSKYTIMTTHKGHLEIIKGRNPEFGSYLGKIVDLVLKGEPITEELKNQSFVKITAQDLLRRKMNAKQLAKDDPIPLSDDNMFKKNISDFTDWIKRDAGKLNKKEVLTILDKVRSYIGTI